MFSGMDWLDMHRLLSFSYPSVSGGVLVRNELKMVHVKSGEMLCLSSHHRCEMVTFVGAL